MGRLIRLRAAVGLHNKVQPIAPAIGAVRTVTIPDNSMLLLLKLIMYFLIACTTGISRQIADIPAAFLSA